MACYICEKCGAIDNTAVGGYWRNILNKEIPKCSECNYGKWHGKFEKKYWYEYKYKELIEMLNGKEFLDDEFEKLKENNDQIIY